MANYYIPFCLYLLKWLASWIWTSPCDFCHHVVWVFLSVLRYKTAAWPDFCYFWDQEAPEVCDWVNEHTLGILCTPRSSYVLGCVFIRHLAETAQAFDWAGILAPQTGHGREGGWRFCPKTRVGGGLDLVCTGRWRARARFQVETRRKKQLEQLKGGRKDFQRQQAVARATSLQTCGWAAGHQVSVDRGRKKSASWLCAVASSRVTTGTTCVRGHSADGCLKCPSPAPSGAWGGGSHLGKDRPQDGVLLSLCVLSSPVSGSKGSFSSQNKAESAEINVIKVSAQPRQGDRAGRLPSQGFPPAEWRALTTCAGWMGNWDQTPRKRKWGSLL